MDSTNIWFLVAGIVATGIVTTILFTRSGQKKRNQARLNRQRYDLWTQRLSPYNRIEIMAKTDDPPAIRFEDEEGEVEMLLARRQRAQQMLEASLTRMQRVGTFLEELRRIKSAPVRMRAASAVLSRFDEGLFVHAERMKDHELRQEDFDDKEFRELLSIYREAVEAQIDELLPDVRSGDLTAFTILNGIVGEASGLYDSLVTDREAPPEPQDWFEILFAYTTAALVGQIAEIRKKSGSNARMSTGQLFERMDIEPRNWSTGFDREALNAMLSLLVNDRSTT